MIQNTDFYREILDNLYDGVYFLDRNRRITYWSKGAERITGFTSAEVVGKSCADDILTHVDEAGARLCVVGCPVAATIQDGLSRTAEIFLHHKDGHRVSVYVRAAALRDAEGRVTGAVEIFSDNSARLAALERIRELEAVAYLDSLTGLANRRYAEIALQTRFDEMQRYGWRFGVILIDLDHFKQINDTHGHAVGDQVLAMVARTLLGNARSFDVVGRWGGEEFLVVAANVDWQKLSAAANRFRMLVERSYLMLNAQIVRTTISGGATLAQPEDTVETLLKRADNLLYQSKANGRNRMTLDLL